MALKKIEQSKSKKAAQRKKNSLLIVAGLTLKQLHPRVWDEGSEYYLPELQAVMVSYADFHRSGEARRKAIEQGIHSYLGVGKDLKVFLDNGAFYFHERERQAPHRDYEEFVEQARPDWWPIPQDFIPTPKMSRSEQRTCFSRTMRMNLAYRHDGYAPVLHVGEFLESYIKKISSHDELMAKRGFALGGIVPNLLRASKAMPYERILKSLRHTRETFAGKKLHVFGIGGTATLHLAALFGIDSVDSSGWRNRAARGIIQLPGSGDRVVADLGKWKGRAPSREEWSMLRQCPCSACDKFGLKGLKANGTHGFCCRATHNISILHNEIQLIEHHIRAKTYKHWYREHLDNSIYLPLIDRALSMINEHNVS